MSYLCVSAAFCGGDGTAAADIIYVMCRLGSSGNIRPRIADDHVVRQDMSGSQRSFSR